MPNSWDVIHSSKDHSWRTPRNVFDALDEEFHFALDAAASDENALCDLFFTEETNALGPKPWTDCLSRGSVWMNPPYGRGVGSWLERAYNESRNGLTVVCLVFACTDTRWWADWVWKAEEVRLVTGRIKFLDREGKPRAAAPKGSAIVIFSPDWKGPPAVKLWSP